MRILIPILFILFYQNLIAQQVNYTVTNYYVDSLFNLHQSSSDYNRKAELEEMIGEYISYNGYNLYLKKQYYKSAEKQYYKVIDSFDQDMGYIKGGQIVEIIGARKSKSTTKNSSGKPMIFVTHFKVRFSKGKDKLIGWARKSDVTNSSRWINVQSFDHPIIFYRKYEEEYYLEQKASKEKLNSLLLKRKENSQAVQKQGIVPSSEIKLSPKSSSTYQTKKKKYTPSVRTPKYRTYYRGPRGGCYYINSNGKKTYVERSKCN